MSHFWPGLWHYLGQTAPDWLTAIGTIGLAIFAVVQIVQSRAETLKANKRADAERDRGNEIEADHRREDEERAERAQAEQVVAWITEPERISFDPSDVRRLVKLRTINIRNESAFPIANVVVRVTSADEVVWSNEDAVAFVAPRFTKRVEPSGTAANIGGSEPWVHLIFTDAQGIRWSRNRTGALEKVSFDDR